MPARAVQELEVLTNSFAQLRAAQAKFKACVENVAEISPNNQGAPPILDAYAVCVC